MGLFAVMVKKEMLFTDFWQLVHGKARSQTVKFMWSHRSAAQYSPLPCKASLKNSIEGFVLFLGSLIFVYRVIVHVNLEKDVYSSYFRLQPMVKAANLLCTKAFGERNVVSFKINKKRVTSILPMLVWNVLSFC